MIRPIEGEGFFSREEKARSIYRAIARRLVSLPDVKVQVTKSQVAFRARRGFAYAWAPKQYITSDVPLVVSFALSERLTSDRFKSVVHPSPKTWMHHVELRVVKDVDRELIGSCVPTTRLGESRGGRMALPGARKDDEGRPMADIEITEHPEQHTAGVREKVPMAGLTDFFSRAFTDTMNVLQAQGISPTGAPFGKYYGRPDAMVDVEAGFPVAAAITPAGAVAPGILPGGSVVEAIHVGSYDTMESTYSEIERYFADAKLTPGDVMWESYLTDPEAEPDPAKWRTQICWPTK